MHLVDLLFYRKISGSGGLTKILEKDLAYTKCELYSNGELVLTPIGNGNTLDTITDTPTTLANLGCNIITPIYGVVKKITVKGSPKRINGYSFTDTAENSVLYQTAIHTASATLPTTINFENDSIESLSLGNFRNNPYLETLNLPSVNSIQKECFYSATALKTLTLGEVEDILESTFRGCVNLENLTFSNSPVKTIGSYAFNHCEKLKSVDFISSLATSIGSNAFSYSGIENITIPATVSSLGADCLSHCTSLKSITFSERTPSGSDSLSLPQNFCYGDTSLEEVALPDYTNAGGLLLNSSAFYQCSSLTEDGIDFSKITGFANNSASNCFSYCSGLVNIDLPNFSGFTNTGQSNMFSYCTNLETVSFGKTSLSTPMSFNVGSTFNQCKKLTKVTFNQPVTAINNSFFLNASSDSAGTGLTIEFKQNTQAEVQALANYPWRMTNATFVYSDS